MNIRSDLAMEATESITDKSSLQGVTQKVYSRNGFTVTQVCITSREGEKLLGKQMGEYVTLEYPKLSSADEKELSLCRELLSRQIASMLPRRFADGCVLVVGLGNRAITPDALGPAASSKIFVTRHLMEALEIDQIDGVQLNCVCSLSPGVLGVTGIETALVIQSLCAKLRPSCVICIDALASMKTSRLLSTVQLASSGIAPGSGVGNHAHALDEKSLGVPVLAIGVPTVVYASTIVRDAANEHIAISEQDDMLVTPRNIDEANEVLSSLIADSINRALQPNLNPVHMH